MWVMAAVCSLNVTKQNPEAQCYYYFLLLLLLINSSYYTNTYNIRSAPCGTNAMSVMAAVCSLNVTKQNLEA